MPEREFNETDMMRLEAIDRALTFDVPWAPPEWITSKIAKRLFELFDRILYAQGVTHLDQVEATELTERFNHYWQDFSQLDEIRILQVLNAFCAELPSDPDPLGQLSVFVKDGDFIAKPRVLPNYGPPNPRPDGTLPPTPTP